MTRGFETAEFQARVARCQAHMAKAGLSAILLTTEPEFRYFSGFLTRFWESPTRPWYLIVPASGDPIAVIPAIGAALMGKTWINDIRTWPSPDLEDDGISLLAETLREISGTDGLIGLPMGPETHLRMPQSDFQNLQARLRPQQFGDDAGIIRRLRMIKSNAEVQKIERICQIANRAFNRVSEIAQAGIPLDQVFRDFQRLCLEEGADWVPYLAGAGDQNGYSDVISPATAAPLESGDVLMLDTGAVWDGYFCDFDRNFSIGAPSPKVSDGHKRLIEATHAAAQSLRPGQTAAELFHVMDKVLTGGANSLDAGRYGHGLGLQLTEWPSLMAGDHTVLEAGMVLTLEPVVLLEDGKIMVHEENVVLSETGCRFLSDPSAPDILQIEAPQ